MKTALTLRDLGYAADLLTAQAQDSRRRSKGYHSKAAIGLAHNRDAVAYEGIARRIREVCTQARSSNLDINQPLEIKPVSSHE